MFLLFMPEQPGTGPDRKMVVNGDDCRDSAEVNVTENMDNNQPSVELVPRTEQNNDERNVRFLFLLYIYHLFFSNLVFLKKIISLQ